MSMKNKRPLFTPEDIETFKFMLVSMRDDYNRYVSEVEFEGKQRDPAWEAKWTKAEALAERILGPEYKTAVLSGKYP